MISFCVILSNAEVASSNIRTLSACTSARAIAILCFCPPESLFPFSPTDTSFSFGNLLRIDSIPTNLHISS